MTRRTCHKVFVDSSVPVRWVFHPSEGTYFHIFLISVSTPWYEPNSLKSFQRSEDVERKYFSICKTPIYKTRLLSTLSNRDFIFFYTSWGQSIPLVWNWISCEIYVIMTPTTSSFFPSTTNFAEASNRSRITTFVYYQRPLLFNNISISVT